MFCSLIKIELAGDCNIDVLPTTLMDILKKDERQQTIILGISLGRVILADMVIRISICLIVSRSE